MKYALGVRRVIGLGLCLVLIGAATIFLFKKYQAHVTAKERETALAALFGIDALNSVTMSKPEFVRQEINVSRLLAAANIAAATNADKQIARELDLYLFEIQSSREARDSLDENMSKLDKTSDSDPYSKLLSDFVGDDRKQQQESQDSAKIIRDKLAKQLE